MLEPQAYTDLKTWLDDIIAYAAVTIDGKTERYQIHRKEYLDDGVRLYIQISPEVAKRSTIQKVQLYNKNGQLWVTKNESIILDEVRESALYRFVFRLKEEEV